MPVACAHEVLPFALVEYCPPVWRIDHDVVRADVGWRGGGGVLPRPPGDGHLGGLAPKVVAAVPGGENGDCNKEEFTNHQLNGHAKTPWADPTELTVSVEMD